MISNLKLEDQKNAELNSGHKTQQEKDAINEKYAKKEAGIKKKAWEAEKVANMEQIAINGALAIIKALAQVGPLGAWVIPGIIGETLAAEAVVASQPTPQFADGGYSAVDYNNPEGYVRRPTLFANSSSGRNFIAGEGYKTEYIVSSEQLKDPVVANFVGMMENNRGVKMFEQGGYSSSATAATKTSTPPASTNDNSSARIDRLEGMMERLIATVKAVDEKPVNFYNTTFEQKNARTVQIRKDATA